MQILHVVFRVAIAMLTPPTDADAAGLHRFAPNEVSSDRARDHVWAARVAAAFYGVDADMVLAIGYHESHFTESAVGPESGGRVSCGTMTPYPTNVCVPRSLLGQYLDGTRHWVIDWRRARDVRGDHEALLGYAGGYALIRACRRGHVLRHATYGDDLCRTPEVFGWIRSRIRSARAVTPS